MQFGNFDDDNHEYLIERADTPRPWANYMGTREYGGIVTKDGGGYSFTQSPAEGRILRHRYNSIPADMPGRQFYVRDRRSNDFWTSTWQPVGKPLDQYQTRTRVGMGYTIVESQYADIATETTYFIPLGRQFEYWRLKITNRGDAARQLSVFPFCEFTGEWNLKNDLLNLQYVMYIGEAQYAGGIIEASSAGRLPQDPKNFANRDQGRFWWMTMTGAEIAGHDCDRDVFLGNYRGFDAPEAVERGACFGSPGYSDNTCGAFQADVDLAPGETREILVMLGIGKRDVAQNVRQEFGAPERCAEELDNLKTWWHDRIEAVQVKTPDADFDHQVNTWGAYNAMLTFEWSRSFSLVYTGEERDGFGYRDTVQDILGVAHMIPETCRDRLILMISGQNSTGGAMPEVRAWSHKPGKMPPTPPEAYRSDDCLWLFNAVPTYVAESGDTGFYDEVIPYCDQGSSSVLGHLRRALEFNLERTGANGLPCGLTADWNDCLKLGYRGESVFVTFQVRLGLLVYIGICKEKNLPDQVEWASEHLDALDKKIAKICWDGEWFIWAIGEDGTVYGTQNYPEGQVYLNTQAWAVLSGAATAEQRDLALNTVARRLATDYGLKLCDPPFVETPVEVMRAVLMNPGNKENGGIFSHAQSWGVLAEIARGNGDQAYKYFRAYMPAAQNDKAEIREIEPYAHCQSTHAAPSPKAGVSRVPWLSGTASWTHYTALHGILGLQAEVGGLRIAPCIPTQWPEFEATKVFRGHKLHIKVTNPDGVSAGVKSLQINGEDLADNLIPIKKLTNGAQIEAVMG